MKVSEILTKSVDIITEQPQMLIPYVIPLVVSLIAIWARMTNMMAWGIGRLYPLGRTPEKFLTYFVTAFRAVDGTALVVWVIVLALLAICVALTIAMSDAALSGRQMKVGEAFDRIGKKVPLFVVAFLISWLLKFFGMLFFWVGIFVPAVLLIFVGQAMLLDNKDLFDSFSKSYDVAKENWIEILVLLFVFLVILAFVRFIPLLGVIVACFLVCYSAVVFTMMYRDRGRAVSAE